MEDCNEGGYCPTYVPFCTHGIIEELSGISTDVGDPFIYAMAGTTYNELLHHQKEMVDEIKDFTLRKRNELSYEKTDK